MAAWHKGPFLSVACQTFGPRSAGGALTLEVGIPTGASAVTAALVGASLAAVSIGRLDSELLAADEHIAGGALNLPAAALPTGHGEAAEELEPLSRQGIAFTGIRDVAESPVCIGSDSEGSPSTCSRSISGGDPSGPARASSDGGKGSV